MMVLLADPAVTMQFAFDVWTDTGRVDNIHNFRLFELFFVSSIYPVYENVPEKPIPFLEFPGPYPESTV
jgi:hypothetical protein